MNSLKLSEPFISLSDEKHVIERYTLIDGGNRMQVEYTFEDPVYLTEPVSMSSNRIYRRIVNSRSR